VPYAEGDPVDHAVLAELGGRLRTIQHVDWAAAGPSRRWRLRRAASGSQR
jgi:hypothetical protein